MLLTSVAHAGLIKDVNAGLIKDVNYITYQGVDFAWASSVNSERWFFNFEYDYNTFLKPKTQAGWDFASDDELSLLTALTRSELLALFTLDNQSLIHAFAFWNDIFTEATVTDGFNCHDPLGIIKDLCATQIRSQWSWTVPDTDNFDSLTASQRVTEGKLQEKSMSESPRTPSYDTFYVRTSLGQGNGNTPIPEPSTLMIFALGLIALAGKKKLFN